MENILLLIFSVFFVVIGIFNMNGNISSIHWYHRTRIKEKDKKYYGKLVGVSTIIIGIGMMVVSILQMIFININFEWLMIIFLVVGMILFIYAQFKYNKGIF